MKILKVTGIILLFIPAMVLIIGLLLTNQNVPHETWNETQY